MLARPKDMTNLSKIWKKQAQKFKNRSNALSLSASVHIQQLAYRLLHLKENHSWKPGISISLVPTTLLEK
jgi:hypothetical protein